MQFFLYLFPLAEDIRHSQVSSCTLFVLFLALLRQTFTGQLSGGLFWQQQRARCSLSFHVILCVGVPSALSSVT